MQNQNNTWSVGMTMKVSDSFDMDDHITEIVDSEGAFIACVNKPNAQYGKLLAAAPELLEALEAMVQYTSGRVGDRLPITGAKAVFDKVNAALSKARGA